MAEPSGNPPGPPHALRTHQRQNRRACCVRDVICNETVPFRPYCEGVVTRTRNVSEYMLVELIAPSGTRHLVSGINFLVLSVNLISAPLSLSFLFMLLPYHIFSLCQLTTLTIHNSLVLSLPPQDLPLSQIFPTIDSLPTSTDFTTGPFLLSVSVFLVFQFLHYSFLFGSVRQIKLATRQLLGAC